MTPDRIKRQDFHKMAPEITQALLAIVDILTSLKKSEDVNM